jgi:RnfABCDGE-type electron transport complex G subunit
MTDTVRFPLVLGAICLGSALGLAIAYSATRDKIRAQERQKKEDAIASVLGVEVRLPESGPEPAVYEASDAETNERLYAAVGAAQGYSSKVQVIVGIGQTIEGAPGSARLRAIRIIKQLETPGLGDRCREEGFQRQFENLPEQHLALIKARHYRNDPDKPGSHEWKVAAITGATITSNAVLDAVRQALERIRHHLAERKRAG